MRAIHIANDKKRDAEVGFEVNAKKSAIHYELPDGQAHTNIKVLKSTIDLTDEALVAKYGDLTAVAQEIIKADPEIDMELIGRKISGTHKLYLDRDNHIAYRVNLVQVVKNPDGTEKERKDLTKAPANANSEIPIQWSGKKFPKAEAIKKFVFTRKYQIRHVSGLTFDFLYNMAKELHESKSLMFVGAGARGNEPIRLVTGGEPYRGFLEGRVEGEKYCLILHLTNIELKGI
ncbi:MAG: hypothetical protein LBL04_03160 [Bacteroidales bacterium]|jgi:hypothetical protein|nr:hypothetical protein [Bacteroidales bacterium]